VPDRASLIESIFSSKDGRKIVRGLNEDDAQSFVDVIDEARFHSEIQGFEVDIYTLCTPGTIGYARPFTADPKKVYQIAVQDMWPSRAPSNRHEGARTV